METKLTATELMIGDWVNIYKFTNEEQQIKDLRPVKVVSILQSNGKENYNTIECVNGTNIASRPADTCLPIPLTAEILEQNGFVKHRDIFYRFAVHIDEFNGFMFTLGRDLDGVFCLQSNRFVRFAYVHELQHALRLCGVDKEIVL